MAAPISSSAGALEVGRESRRDKPPTWLADWHRTDAVDPVAILGQVAQGRDPHLVKLRNREMAASAFSFLRGAAAVDGRRPGGVAGPHLGYRPGHLRRRSSGQLRRLLLARARARVRCERL